MSELLAAFTSFITSLDPVAIYAVLMLIAYLENVIPPIPGDVMIVYGGYLAAGHIIALLPLLVITSIAATAGFLTYFYLGWRWGTEEAIATRHRILSRFIDTNHIDRALHYMNRYGEWVILANRFLAGTRSIISIAAGMSRMNPWQTAANSLLSAVLWNAVLIGAGWQLQTNWEIFGSYLKAYGQIVGGIIGLTLATWWLLKKRRDRALVQNKKT
jgi:membrane protein DedA with SNARE-associated domain